MRTTAIASLLLVAACVSRGTTAPPEVDPYFAEFRPVMVSVQVSGDDARAEGLREALYRGLIEKDYSALAPGAPAGSETGVFRVALSGKDANAALETPDGKVLFRSSVNGFTGPDASLARDLLAGLPRK